LTNKNRRFSFFGGRRSTYSLKAFSLSFPLRLPPWFVSVDWSDLFITLTAPSVYHTLF
jgi:hypothetical protein